MAKNFWQKMKMKDIGSTHGEVIFSVFCYGVCRVTSILLTSSLIQYYIIIMLHQYVYLSLLIN